MTLPAQARIVIVGGGIAGCSTAYHLAQLGQTDVLRQPRLALEQIERGIGRRAGERIAHVSGAVHQRLFRIV